MCLVHELCKILAIKLNAKLHNWGVTYTYILFLFKMVHTKYIASFLHPIDRNMP